MSEKLPKPMLEALAKTKPAEHPSADMLAAFVEQVLTEREKQTITDHLAECGECREVVFLASNAAENQVAEREDDLRVVALRRDFHTAAMPEAFMTRSFGASPTRASEGEVPLVKTPKHWWPRLVWAGALAAVVVVSASYFAVHERSARLAAPVEMAARPMQEDQTSAQVETPLKQAAPASKPDMVAPKITAKTQAKSAPAPAGPAKATPAAGSQATSEYLAAVPPQPSPAVTTETRVQAKRAPGATDVAIGEAIRRNAAVQATPRASGFAPSTSEAGRALTGAAPGEFATQKAAVNLLQSLHPGWRVTAEGHLEHNIAGTWTQVLSGQKDAFRVVALLGSDVWTGGNGGMLFHSSDGGQTWKKVVVSGVGGAAIVSIRFDDPQTATIIADDGTSWATSDGGATWVKQ